MAFIHINSVISTLAVNTCSLDPSLPLAAGISPPNAPAALPFIFYSPGPCQMFGRLHCDFVFFFVRIHANMCYTAIHDRFLVIVCPGAPGLPQGNNPRLSVAMHHLVAYICLSGTDDSCNHGTGCSICSTGCGGMVQVRLCGKWNKDGSETNDN